MSAAAPSAPAPLADLAVLRFLLQLVGRRQAIALFATAAGLSVLDIFGIAMVFPFLEAVAQPEGRVSQALAGWLPGVDRATLLLCLSASLVALFIVKSALQTMLLRYQLRRMAHLTAGLTNDMVTYILHARYATFQKTAASNLAGVAYSNTVHAAVAFNALVQGLNEVIFLGLLLVAFLVAQPALALSLIAVLAALAAALYFGLVRRTSSLGQTQTRIESLRYRLLYSIVSAIRDINIMGLAPLFDARNREVSALYADVVWRYNLSSVLPRLFIELALLIGLVGCVAFYVLSGLSVEKIAPLLGVAVVAAIRTVPAFSRLIGAVNTYRFSKPVVARLLDVRAELTAAAIARKEDDLRFTRAIELRGVGFRYGTVATLRNVDMVIPRGQSIGIVGPSGSGKTTLLDIITGLQPAAEGRFLCDGQPFEPFTSQSMQRLTGYVPQSITLLDESIAFNISFDHRPDPARLQRAIRVANLEQFVAALPEGADTQVGENGVRLSGGQRQRVGIARAIYREPAILVFDEATSSLDKISERELTAEIAQLRGGITKIIVTHRLSTIAACDHIYVLSRGAVVDSGSYRELLERCALFRQLDSDESEAEPALEERAVL